jgi:hypothetical protein
MVISPFLTTERIAHNRLGSFCDIGRIRVGLYLWGWPRQAIVGRRMTKVVPFPRVVTNDSVPLCFLTTML